MLVNNDCDCILGYIVAFFERLQMSGESSLINQQYVLANDGY